MSGPGSKPVFVAQGKPHVHKVFFRFAGYCLASIRIPWYKPYGPSEKPFGPSDQGVLYSYFQGSIMVLLKGSMQRLGRSTSA